MKIVSYRQNISGIDIAGQKDILWPCHAFTITVPIQKEKDLNIFEETVLKLIEVETSESEKLSELLSLKVELIDFIKARLVELELISERFVLRASGIELIEKLENEEEQYEIVTLFLNLVSGEMLPIVVKEVEVIHEYQEEEGEISFTIGSFGNGKKIYSKKIRYDSQYKNKKISEETVRRTINTFRKLYNRFSFTLSSKIILPRFSRKMGSITINPKPEEVYLHCKLIIQKGHSEVLVTDPFGFDFSSQLTKYIQNSDNANSLTKLKKSIIMVKIENKENSKDKNFKDDWTKEEFSISELNKYQSIKKHLKRIEENYKKSKEKSDSSDSEQKIKNARSRLVQNLYEVIESALKQVEKDYPSEVEYKEIFASQSSKINQQILDKFSKKLGFDVPKYKSFLNLQPNMISSLDNGIIRPEAMVALALSKANEDSTHPFYLLAKNVPDFFEYIKKLQGYRNSVAHGSELDVRILKIASWKCMNCHLVIEKNIENKTCEDCKGKLIGITELDNLKEMTYLTLKSLYPSLFLKERKINKDFFKKVEFPNQDILKAKIGLDENFSLIFINHLKSNQTLYDQFIKIEEAELNLDKNANVYINSIYSVLQIILDIYIIGIQQELDLHTIRGIALKNANVVGLTLPNKQWTDELTHVGKKMIKNASKGISSSLGASIIVFLAFESKEKLENLKLKIPEFIIKISLVLKLRGHGDKSSIDVIEDIGNKEKLVDLKKSIYTIIKILEER